jgi:hypothetical protein
MFSASDVALQDYRGALANQPEPPADAFCVNQDFLDYLTHRIEQQNRSLAVYNLGRVIENYREGNLAVCVRVRIQPRAAEHDLVFLSIEEVGDVKRNTQGRRSKRHVQGCVEELHRNQAGMLFGVSKLVQSPKGVISSLVRLEPAKERVDFRWQVADAFDSVFKMRGVGSEREVGGADFGLATEVQSAGCVGDLVKAGSQVVDGIEDDAGQVGEAFSELEFVDLCRSFDVALDIARPRLLVYDTLEPGIEIVDVVMCTTERAFGAGERVHAGRLPQTIGAR